MANITKTMKIEDIPYDYNGWIATFSYKGKRYYRGAFIPWRGAYEIYTIKGDLCKLIEPGTVVTNPRLEDID